MPHHEWKKGIDVSVEDLIELKDKLCKTGDGELSESELEATAGGGDLWSLFTSAEEFGKKLFSTKW